MSYLFNNEQEIKNDSGNPIPVSGLVAISGSVITNDPPGTFYSFNNHATAFHRGFTLEQDVMTPILSIRVNSTGTTITDLVTIEDYEMGNNNANQSTIIYEWYEGAVTIGGTPGTPAWSSVGTKTQYRWYTDAYGSQVPNTLSIGSAVMRHSGIVIGKNSSAEVGPATMHGGATPNMLTLCAKRVDSSTKLDLWLTFTIKELG